MDINQIQTDYDLLQNEIKVHNEIIKQLKSDQQKLIGPASTLNYTLKNHKFVINELIYVVDYDLSYYSHFDGHLSDAIEYDYSGSYKITKEQYDLLKSTIEEYLINKEDNFLIDHSNSELYDQLWEIVPESMDSCSMDPDRMLQYIKLTEDGIYFEKTGSRDQGRMNPGSYFKIKLKPISEYKPFEKSND